MAKSDIIFRDNWLGFIPNPNAHREIKEALREISHTVPHRRGIILGYRMLNLDSMKEEGLITEGERKASHRILQRGYDIIE